MKSIPKREVQMNQKEHQKENSGNAPQSKQSAVQNDAYDVEAGDARRNATVNQPPPATTQNSQERRKTQQEWAKDVFQEVNDIFAEINYRLLGMESYEMEGYQERIQRTEKQIRE